MLRNISGETKLCKALRTLNLCMDQLPPMDASRYANEPEDRDRLTGRRLTEAERKEWQENKATYEAMLIKQKIFIDYHMDPWLTTLFCILRKDAKMLTIRITSRDDSPILP